MNRTDELYHYGVLGMKWGIRRARKNYEKAASYKKKGNAEKAKKYQEKAKKIEAKHKRLGGTTTYNKVKNTSTGKLVVQSYLLGTYGALKYNEAKSKGASRGAAFVNGLVYGTVNNLTGGIMSIVEPRM